MRTVDFKSGYAYSSDIEAASGGQVKNPEEAGEWMRAHKGTYTDIPVYLSDGQTQIGVYRIGDWEGVEFQP